MRRWWFFGLVVWLLTLGGHASAAAEPPRLEVRVQASADDSAALVRTVRDALASFELTVNTELDPAVDANLVAQSATREDPALAWLWLQAADPGRVVLYVTTQKPPRVFVRRFAFQAGLDPVALELLGVAVQGAIEAVLSGHEIGMPPEEFEQAFVAPPTAALHPVERVPRAEAPVVPSRSERRLRASVLYEAELLDRNTVEHGPGLELALELPKLRFGLAAQLRFPLHFTSDDLNATLSSRSGRAFVALPLRLSHGLDASLGVAIGLDWIGVKVRATSADATPRTAFDAVDMVTRAFASIERRWGALEASATVGGELGLVPAEYSYRDVNQRVVLFTPWRVRTLFSISVGTPF